MTKQEKAIAQKEMMSVKSKRDSLNMRTDKKIKEIE